MDIICNNCSFQWKGQCDNQKDIKWLTLYFRSCFSVIVCVELVGRIPGTKNNFNVLMTSPIQKYIPMVMLISIMPLGTEFLWVGVLERRCIYLRMESILIRKYLPKKYTTPNIRTNQDIPTARRPPENPSNAVSVSYNLCLKYMVSIIESGRNFVHTRHRNIS